MFEFVGNVVQGGWDALGNVASTVGKGASYFVSDFFPAQQRSTMTSELAAPAGGSGMTYRPVIQENRSMVETWDFMSKGWIDTPYEQQFAVPIKVAESKALSDSISTMTQPDQKLSGLLSSVLGGIRQIKTVADEFIDLLGLKKHEPVSAGPTEIGNSPGVVVNTEPIREAGADVLTRIQLAGREMINQVKGLFGLGYPQTEPQGVYPVVTSIGGISAMSLLIIAGIVILIIFLRSKK